MRRTRIDIEVIGELNNLVLAAWKAGRGKHGRPKVAAFFSDLDANLEQLGADILDGRAPYGRYKQFVIHDPKRRLIHAACFEDRVVHHAIMNLAGPLFEKAMAPTTYACLPGRGVHKVAGAVLAAMRRYPWYVKIDIDSYFNSICHARLFSLLQRRFKGDEFLNLLRRIIESHDVGSKRGLPIGSLTSQYFANYYLDRLDRLLLGHSQVRASLRYMDDIIWWCDSRQNAAQTLESVRTHIEKECRLTVKGNIQINRSDFGVTYCGYRIKPSGIGLSPRRKRRYRERRQYWEDAWEAGEISALELQNRYASVHAILQGAESHAWRRSVLLRDAPVDV
ncbi:MAG: hypothetical protein DIZ78_05020 [endosymbiont of Escarpia spicata]|uniref:Reverse transcriptase domain-containing protein n=1 Tax=endosymbiont of Escarpia spicata TaxID=2200908 RepID=A0A370DTL9_9GAMM|nr:MAG: hypothetical protein DIZ78_05020 [endosymbiont of Escarpia spicata]